MFGTSIQDGDTKSTKNFGGVCVAITSRLAPYVESVRSSKRGNFVSVTLQGQQGRKSTIICSYRRVPGSNSSGDSTVWRQQQNQQILESGDKLDLVDPRKECLIELEREIKKQ